MDKRTYQETYLRHGQIHAKLESYHFSSAFSVQFCDTWAKDYGLGKYQGKNQFRVDFTRAGRFECAFLDHSFSYRGENDITVLATPLSENWLAQGFLPTNYHVGCVILIELDKLSPEDYRLFSFFNIDINTLIRQLNIIQKWHKITDHEQLKAAFHQLYALHQDQKETLILLRALEILCLLDSPILMARNKQNTTVFYPAQQIQMVKDIHRYLLAHWDMPLTFSALLDEYDISYTRFNKIFQAIYGETPYQYLKSHRMEKAKELLLKTDKSVIEVANLVSYTNASKFATAFKAVVGVTPHQFRQQTKWSIS